MLELYIFFIPAYFHHQVVFLARTPISCKLRLKCVLSIIKSSMGMLSGKYGISS